LNSSMEPVNGQADAIMTFNQRHFVSVRNPHLGDEQFGIEVLARRLRGSTARRTVEPIRRLFDLVADEGAVALAVVAWRPSIKILGRVADHQGRELHTAPISDSCREPTADLGHRCALGEPIDFDIGRD
jgi:hypothetical protein